MGCTYKAGFHPPKQNHSKMNNKRLQQSTISFFRSKGGSLSKESSPKTTEEIQIECPVCGHLVFIILLLLRIV